MLATDSDNSKLKLAIQNQHEEVVDVSKCLFEFPTWFDSSSGITHSISSIETASLKRNKKNKGRK